MKPGPVEEQPVYSTGKPPLQSSFLSLDHPLTILSIMFFIPIELYWRIPIVKSEGDEFFYNWKFLFPQRQAKGLF